MYIFEAIKYVIITRLGQLGANISPDRSSLMPQVLIGNFLCKPFVVCHKSWEKLYELQHINLLSKFISSQGRWCIPRRRIHNRAYFQSSCNDNSEPIFKVFK